MANNSNTIRSVVIFAVAFAVAFLATWFLMKK